MRGKPRLSHVAAWTAVAAALSFVGFIAAGFYAGVDENVGAGFLAFLFLVGSVLCGAAAIVTFVMSRRSRPAPRGFDVTFPADRAGPGKG